jgi:sporulation protein YlmC with PRC-barrel domain
MTERRARSTGPVLVRLSESGLVLEDLTQDVRGLDVYDRSGDRIGKVEDLYADAQERKVRFLDVAAGGFMGLGEKRFLIPVEAVGEVREDGGVVVVEQKRRKVAESPLFDAEVVVPQPPISTYSTNTTVTSLTCTESVSPAFPGGLVALLPGNGVSEAARTSRSAPSWRRLRWARRPKGSGSADHALGGRGCSSRA